MSDIRDKNFWTDLLKKIAKIILKDSGLSKRKKTNHQHVVPHDEGWAVKGQGNSKYTAIYKYQDDAIRRARSIAKKHGADVIIHGRDGRVRDRMSFDKD